MKKARIKTPQSSLGLSHDATEPDDTLSKVFKKKWKEVLAGTLIGWLVGTAMFFITPYSDFLKYHIMNDWRPLGKPTKGDLTGNWNFSLAGKEGVYEGTVELIQNGRRLDGHYKASRNGDGEFNGAVLSGTVDSAVSIQLMWDSGSRYWQIPAATKSEELGKINLSSENGRLYQRCVSGPNCGPSGWEQLDDKISFHAVADEY